MGYTNYWMRPAELPQREFDAAISDLRLVLLLLKKEVTGPRGIGEPILNDRQILFNGHSPAICESFCLFRIQPDDEASSRGFCKTRQLPYDVAVKVALLVLKHHLGDQFKYGSDGDDQQLWQRARKICRKVFAWQDETRPTTAKVPIA